MRTEFTEEKFEVVAFRLPPAIRVEAQVKAESEDITFSQLMRRALRRELGQPLPLAAKRGGRK